MGRIIEPKGVDFIINSPPLSEKEKREISEFIKKRKKETKDMSKTSKKIENKS